MEWLPYWRRSSRDCTGISPWTTDPCHESVDRFHASIGRNGKSRLWRTSEIYLEMGIGYMWHHDCSRFTDRRDFIIRRLSLNSILLASLKECLLISTF